MSDGRFRGTNSDRKLEYLRDFCPSHNFIVPPSESPSERLGTLETQALNLRLDSSLGVPARELNGEGN